MRSKCIGLVLAASLAASLFTGSVMAEETAAPAAEGQYNGHTYQVFDESITWQEAKAKCEKLGGHLVTIASENENKFVADLISECEKNLYWIGCFENEKTGEWQWIDGSKLSYDNWAYKEPNNSNGVEIYGHMFRFDYDEYDIGSDDHNAGEWNNLPDGGEARTSGGYILSKIGYVCEWDHIFSSFGSEISQWAADEIEKAYDKKLIPDSLVGKDLTQPITRAEFAAVSVKTYELMANTTVLPVVNNPFTDTKDVEVLKALNTGITIGISDDQFAPDVLLNREQAATMLTRVFKRATMIGWTIQTDDQFELSYDKPAKFADDKNISDWAKDSVYFMAANGIIDGIGENKFAPQNTTSEEEAKGYANATREQALVIATRMVEKLK